MATDASILREELWGLLGDLPGREAPVSCTVVAVEEREDYVLEVLRLELNGIETVPAFFARPRGVEGPLPTVLFNHSHGGGLRARQERTDGRR